MSESSRGTPSDLQDLLDTVLQWEASMPHPPPVPPVRRRQSCCCVSLLYFSPFTKVKQEDGRMGGAVGKGVCGAPPSWGRERERGWGARGRPPGRVLGPLEGKRLSCPPFCLLYFEGPRPQVSPPGGAATPSSRAPASWVHRCHFCCCHQLPTAPGQVWGRAQTPDGGGRLSG